MNPLISIIIPVYNIEKHIGKCIKSCIHQTYTNTEIIIINDGSTDNSLHIINSFISKDKRIKTITKKNEGLLAARVTGITTAKGLYILHVDGDDFLPFNAIELLYKKAQATNALYVKGAATHINENGSFISSLSISEPNNFLNDIITKHYWSICGCLIHKSLYNNFSINTSLSIGEDLITTLYLLSQKRCVTSYTNESVYMYVYHKNSMTNKPTKNNRKYFILIQEIDKIINKKFFEEKIQNNLKHLIIQYILTEINLDILNKKERNITLHLLKKYFYFNIREHQNWIKENIKTYLLLLSYLKYYLKG